MFRQIIKSVLRYLSDAILAKYSPRIIMITGSVGKSSTKEAVFHVLSSKFSVRKNEANYNTEIGAATTIIGGEPGGRSVSKWFEVFAKGAGLILFKKEYPQFLVLEAGADAPGDLEYLTEFVKPDISIVTNIGVSHLEKFGSRDAIKKEKGAIIRALNPDRGVAILNKDDADGAMSLENQTKALALTYGRDDSADFFITEPQYKYDESGKFKTSFYELTYKGQKYEVYLNKSLGEPAIYASLAAIVAGVAAGMTANEAVQAVADYQGLPGRLRPIDGINGSLIIDDAYNSAPVSAMAAVDLLASIPAKRRIAVIGKMAELGEESDNAHRRVGEYVAGKELDMLLVRDNEARLIGEQAAAKGMPADKIKYFSDKAQVAESLRQMLEPGDAVLFKASRSEYFEDIIREIRARS